MINPIEKNQELAFRMTKSSPKKVRAIMHTFDKGSIVKKFKENPNMAKEEQMREMALKMKKWLRNLPKRIERHVVNSFFDPNAEEIFPKKDNCHDLK